MESIEGKLTDAVAAAMSSQLDVTTPETPGTDEQANRETAERLVREALSHGHGGQSNVGEVHRFTAGNTALMVARVDTTVSFVVKVDHSPGLVTEAHLLQRAASDPSLPEATRRAFPAVYAVDDVGPVYGYLMENLEGYQLLAAELVEQSDAECVRLVEELWTTVLAPAYVATRKRRRAPNVRLSRSPWNFVVAIR